VWPIASTSVEFVDLDTFSARVLTSVLASAAL